MEPLTAALIGLVVGGIVGFLVGIAVGGLGLGEVAEVAEVFG